MLKTFAATVLATSLAAGTAAAAMGGGGGGAGGMGVNGTNYGQSTLGNEPAPAKTVKHKHKTVKKPVTPPAHD